MSRSYDPSARARDPTLRNLEATKDERGRTSCRSAAPHSPRRWRARGRLAKARLQNEVLDRRELEGGPDNETVYFTFDYAGRAASLKYRDHLQANGYDAQGRRKKGNGSSLCPASQALLVAEGFYGV